MTMIGTLNKDRTEIYYHPREVHYPLTKQSLGIISERHDQRIYQFELIEEIVDLGIHGSSLRLFANIVLHSNVKAENSIQTKEEILDRFLNGFNWIYQSRENALKAMQVYAEQYHREELYKHQIKGMHPITIISLCGTEKWKECMHYQLQPNGCLNCTKYFITEAKCLHVWDEGHHGVHKCTLCGKYNC